MTKKEAYEILGLPPGAGIEETKRKYRQLITQAHPDSQAFSKENPGHSAQEINIAYAILKKRNARPEPVAAKSQKRVPWNAPVNECAYMEREILHYAQDCDGKILGSSSIARGKYLWITEEDFPLFLLSIYKCGKQLLDEADDQLPVKKPSEIRQRFQAELTYLLAQQFIDATSLLGELAKETSSDKEGNPIYFISATLELSNRTQPLSPGETLSPSRLQSHKLYLKNQFGQQLGYLSFPDDRLYYIIVPLLEQRKVQVRIQAAGIRKGKSENLHLWLKLLPAPTAMPENLNLQIQQLLELFSASNSDSPQASHGQSKSSAPPER